ncbi:MAG: DNA-binding protein [Eubacteriales bacterium]|nr:DNA-binding protein [Eubacteriales bacterium]
MFSYEGAKLGRVFMLYLGKGEDVLKSIQTEIDRQGVRSGVMLSAIGSARKIVYHRISKLIDTNSDEFLTVEGPIEIGAIQGLILEGKPHLHITFSDRSGTYSGHLEPGCEVQYLAEIAFAELLDAPVVRKHNENGISYMALD